MEPKTDITGQRFGKLTAQHQDRDFKETYRRDTNGGKRKSTCFHYPNWICKCDCGRTCSVRKQQLIRGRVKSCGCAQHDPKKDFQAQKNRLYRSYQRSAVKRALSLELTRDELVDLAIQRCYYCGSTPEGEIWPHHGIDRLNNEAGYIAGNVVPCCKKCNFAKGTLFSTEFISLCKAVAAHCASEQEAACA